MLKVKINTWLIIVLIVLVSVRDISAALNINSSGSLTKGFASFCKIEEATIEATATLAKQQRPSKLERTARPAQEAVRKKGIRTKGTTNNLMDYNGGYFYNKQQWSDVHDPNALSNLLGTLVQDGESGSLVIDWDNYVKTNYFQCYSTYQNYDGIIPECAWNNNCLNIDDAKCKARAIFFGMIDGAFLTIKDAYTLVNFLSCWNFAGPLSNSIDCYLARQQTVLTLRSIKTFCEDPQARIAAWDKLRVSIGDWSNQTFCPNLTCAYNQGRMLYNLAGLFYGGSEAKALMKAGITGAKLATLVTNAEHTLLEIGRVFTKVGNEIKLVGSITYLYVKTKTSNKFTLATVDKLKKAIRFNVPIIKTKLSTATKIDELKDVAYVATENGQELVKRGDFDIVDEDGVAKVVVSGNFSGLISKLKNKSLETQLLLDISANSSLKNLMLGNNEIVEAWEILFTKPQFRIDLDKLNRMYLDSKTEPLFANWININPSKLDSWNVWKGTYNSLGDPVKNILGSGKTSHPSEWSQIINEIKAAGGEVIFRPGAIAYSPGLKKGTAGQLIIDPNASITALRHEHRHFLDDQQAGYKGFEGIFDSNFRITTEYNAYKIEILEMINQGQTTVANQLKNNFQAEVNDIINKIGAPTNPSVTNLITQLMNL